MIRFEHVAITYPDRRTPTLRDVDLVIPEGEFCLVTGGTGTGKSTLLGAINGLVPHFTGGRLSGRVVVDGRDTASSPPRDLADVVGVVGQDPLAGFVTDTVEEELAYTMEQLALAPDVMRKRVEETLDLLGIAELRDRALRTLSGGQQQRVAIGSVLTAQPRVIVLDEPTSALDPTAAEDVLAVVTRLVHDLGVTAVVAEHRLERVVHAADRMLLVHEDGTVSDGSPTEVLVDSPVAPPVVHLGRLAGWSPLPLSVRDARRVAGPLRDQLAQRSVAGTPTRGTPMRGHAADRRGAPAAGAGTDPSADPDGGAAIDANRVVVRHGDTWAVRGVDVTVAPGEVVALMGRNGSGKSSLLWALQGSGPRSSGAVSIGGVDPATLRPGDARRLVGLVPQSPSDLLYLSSVAEECARADSDADVPAGTTAGLLAGIVAGIDPDAHPRDLSEGQRLALVLAIQLSARPRTVLLDEPTRGLDYGAKAALTARIAELSSARHPVVVATHDVEFVAGTADRVVVLADGEIVADGPTAEVVVASPAFAPQVAKILAPDPWLTVDDVAEALTADASAADPLRTDPLPAEGAR